eukprot:131751-Pyramimonas_sp.AAC.1
MFFHSALCDVKLCAVFTWHSDKGPQRTYQCSSGTEHRIGYVGTPQTWKEYIVKQGVWYDIDVDRSHQDHYPVRANLAWAGQAAGKQSLPAFDPDLRQDPDRCEAFEQEMRDCPLVHWSVDVNDHFAILSRRSHDCDSKHFCRRTKGALK